MVESSKILTVSYGTFSCTLEGFDDSFATMKAIAEYFRDLAERDRYFGAEPPTPDAEMLTRIAEREIDRRVDARMDDNGIVLRAAEATAPAAPIAAAAEALAPAADPAPVMPPQPTPPASVVAPVEAETATTGLFEENMENDEDDPSSDMSASEDRAASDDLANDPAYITAEDIAEQAAAQQSETALLDTSADEAEESDEGLTFSDMAPAGLAAVPASSDPSSVAAKLRRIRAVVGQGTTEDETSERTDDNAPFVANDDISDAVEAADDETSDFEDAFVAEEPVVTEEDHAPVAVDEAEAEVSLDTVEDDDTSEPLQLGEDMAVESPLVLSDEVEDLVKADASDDAEASVEEVEAAEETVEDEQESASEDADEATEDDASEAATAAPVEEQPAKQSIRARILRVARPLRPTPVDVAIEDSSELEDIAKPEAADEEPSTEAELGDVEGLISRVRSNTSETVETDQVNGTAFEPSVEEKLEGSEDADETDKASSTLDALKDGQADDQELVDETELETAADVEATLSPEDEAELQDELAEVEREIEQTKSESRQGRDILPENDDAAMSRILDRADQQLAEPESSRRRNAISQLKAAVAATEAARQLGDKSDAVKSEDEFRNDLEDVVRPRRASSLPKAEIRTERPRPAPLKLVAAQRIDAVEDSKPAAPVQARRVAAVASSTTDASNFAEFAQEMGATELEDLLEAAAAYTAFVEGNEDFSRPQIMQKVQATSETGYSREDSLRSFGTLLREGRINKVRNGRFQISSQSRFNPEQKAG